MARRLSSPAFIGRTSELKSLQRAAEAADDARPSLLLLGGEAGVGKSRLLGELIADRGASGWLVLEGATIAVGAEGLPFEPVAAALRSAVRALGLERQAREARLQAKRQGYPISPFKVSRIRAGLDGLKRVLRPASTGSA
jgi:predicted ATPase